jgi:hypothetical protein
MVFYRPPKSSIWGHSLRKMKPSVQLEKTNELKNILSYECEQELFDIVFYDDSRYKKKVAEIDFNNVCEMFKSYIDCQIFTPGTNYKMNELQFQLALEKLKSFEAMFSKITTDIVLSHRLNIKGWHINNTYVKTNAEITHVYGTSPHIGTEILFNNRNEFYYLKNLLGTLGLCELNEKYLSKER